MISRIELDTLPRPETVPEYVARVATYVSREHFRQTTLGHIEIESVIVLAEWAAAGITALIREQLAVEQFLNGLFRPKE